MAAGGDGVLRGRPTSTVEAQLHAASGRLRAARLPTPALDAEVLLGHVLGVCREAFFTHPERRLNLAQQRRYTRLVDRRVARVPVAYLTGVREFFGHPLRVTPRVLIPRPETEILVERAILFLRSHPKKRDVIDLGTGSGAIAVAVARAAPHARIQALDISRAALLVASRNARALKIVRQVVFRQSDLLARARPADLILANLPYLSASRRRTMPEDVRHEPLAALNGGQDGLSLIRRALRQAPSVVRPGGCLLFECDPLQARRLESLALETWPQAIVQTVRDLAGRPRVVEVHVP